MTIVVMVVEMAQRGDDVKREEDGVRNHVSVILTPHPPPPPPEKHIIIT